MENSFENELLQLEKYVASEEEYAEKYYEDTEDPLGEILHNVEEAAKRGRPYDILDVAYIGDMCGLAEDKIQLLKNNCMYFPSEDIRNRAKYEKYVICHAIGYYSDDEPDQLVYCGNHLFILKEYQILVEILENSVIIHKYY